MPLIFLAPIPVHPQMQPTSPVLAVHRRKQAAPPVYKEKPIPSNLPPIPSDLPPIPSDLPPIPSDLPPIPSDLPPVPSNLPPVPSNLPPIPSDLPLKDLVPEIIPEVPLHGTASAPLNEFLAWRAEIDAATFELSKAATEVHAASSNMAATKAAINAALASHSAAAKQELNAKARSSAALKRRRFAWEQYLALWAKALPDLDSDSDSDSDLGLGPGSGSGSPTRSMAFLSPTPFKGLSVDSRNDGYETEEMEL
jgi:hypothetical protein